MKKQMIFKMGITLLLLIIIGVCAFWSYRTFFAKNGGTIRIIITNEFNNDLRNDLIEFDEGDTLVGILGEHYECTVENGMLLDLDGLKTPSDWSYFICIYVNGEMSTYGINDLKFKDKDVISFVFTDASTYE